MDTGAIVIKAVTDRVSDDGCQRSQIGHVAPQTVACGQMRGMYLSRFGTVKVLGWIGKTPTIHISDLRTMRAHNAPQLSSSDHPTSRITRWNHQFFP
jgi:hypothetical protein